MTTDLPVLDDGYVHPPIFRRDLVRVRPVTAARVVSCRRRVQLDEKRGRRPYPLTALVASVQLPE